MTSMCYITYYIIVLLLLKHDYKHILHVNSDPEVTSNYHCEVNVVE